MADTEQRLRQIARRYKVRMGQLEAERDETIRAAAGEGMSLRRIGKIVGLSHQRVHQIVRNSRV